jgi:transcriptional regulator with PAS, ATPase and Fis domain
LQAKLLKVLHEKTFERLGSLNTLKTNARVLAATNRDLRQMVREGKFREDLYYRLNVFPISIPPLRERKQHLETIALYLAGVIARKLGKAPKVVPEESLTEIRRYHWPGNIRELENVIERAIIMSKRTALTLSALDERTEPAVEQQGNGDLKTVEQKAIQDALLQTNGNRKRAAEMLGISLRSLQYKIKEYGIA